MTDYTELQKAAAYASQDTIKFADEDEEMRALQQFHEEVTPETVLALIAENEALQKSYAEAWEKARALQSECDEFARDAERYRWLRAQHWDSSAICCVVDPKLCTKLGSYCPSLELLDQAVDAGLKLSKESPNG